MAPKPAPKLTKKQLDQLKKQEARKREVEEKQRKEEQQQRLKEKLRLDQIDREKRTEEEKVRIVLEKEKYRQKLMTNLKEEAKSQQKMEEQKSWDSLTTQYFKSYDTSGPNLSTFINVLNDEVEKTPEKVLKSCEEGQIYVKYIYERLLRSRAEGNKEEEDYYRTSIERIRSIEMEKIEKILIDMANGAEDMEEKNNQFTKKGQPNRKADGQKLLEYQHQLSKNIKIGMFLNSSTTKPSNKFKPIEIKQFGLNTEIPSKWMNANTIVRFQWINFNPYSPETYEKFLHIGGVYNLEFYQLLLGSKKINNITLKKLYKGKEILDKFKLPTAIIKQPFNVAYQVPKNIFLHTYDPSTLRFAQYDFSNSKWSALPGDTVVEYDAKEKKVVCRIFRPEPIAYIQDRCTDYPYISWELRSVEPGKAHLDIQLKRHLNKKQEEEAQRLMVKFEIDASSVKLVMNQKYPELEDLCTEPRSPELLLYELSTRGIHLLPIDEDYEEAKLPAKDRQAEQNAIRDISYAIESFYIRSEINDSHEIVVKIRQNEDYESVFLEDQEKDWKKIRWAGPDRCWVTNRKVEERHLNLEILLDSHDICRKECVERMKFDKNYLFKKNVMKMLSLTRILSFIEKTNEPSNLRWFLKEKLIVK